MFGLDEKTVNQYDGQEVTRKSLIWIERAEKDWLTQSEL